MKKLMIMWLILGLCACNAQDKEKKDLKAREASKTSKPQEKWDVKKEYDKDGNLIRYDSVYVWNYSNVKGDSIRINLDSIMDNFRTKFKTEMPYKWGEDFSYFPKDDSLFMKDFFTEDYYLNNWKRQKMELETFIKKMDSSRNAFLKKNYPGLMSSKKMKQ